MNDERYVHAKIFKEKFGIPETTLRNYAKDGIVKYKKMAHGTRLYDINDGPVLVKMREIGVRSGISIIERNINSHSKVGIKSDKRSKICYSRVDDETKSNILEYEKKLFEKFIPHCEIIQEYREADDNEKSKLLDIMTRIVNREIEMIYIISIDSIAKDTFPIVDSILKLNNVILYILKENGDYIDFHHPEVGDFSSIDDFIRRVTKRIETDF